MAKDKTNEQLGEDPKILKDIAKAIKDLADFLKLHDIKVDYCEADWKDTEGLVEDACKLRIEHPNWTMYYFCGDTWGIDANYVFFTSNAVPREVVEKIGEYIVEFGAELPEEVVPPKPKCPKCGKEIEHLVGVYKATASGWVNILDGKLNLQLEEDLKPWEMIDEDSAVWYCPECEAELFRAGQEAEMTAFLLCDKEYKAEEKEKPFSSGQCH